MGESLKDLCAEYENSISVQREIIAKNRQKLKTAMAKRNRGEVERLNRLLRTLYEEKLELELAANEMKKYYS